MRKRIFATLTILAAGVLLITGCQAFAGSTQQPEDIPPTVTQAPGVIAEGRLVPHEYVDLSFNSGGKVAEVLASEGDQVQAGQVIARLDQREQFASAVDNAAYELLNARQALKDLRENADVNTAGALQKVADARDAVRDAERYLNNLRAGGRKTDIDSASADVVLLKDRLDTAQEDFAPYAKKPEDNLNRAVYLSKLADAQRKYDDAVRLLNNLEGPANQVDLAVAGADLSLAQARLALAEQQYEDVKNGPDPDDLAKAEARVKAAETTQAAAQEALADRELKVPFSGTLAHLDLKNGEQVGPGQVVVVLADLSQWVVETDDLTEIDVPQVHQGQKVRLTFDALPDVELPGSVESISEVHEQKHGDITYTVKIALAKSDPRLRWGMTAVAHFEE